MHNVRLFTPETGLSWGGLKALRAVRELRAWKQEVSSEFKRPWGAKATEDAGARGVGVCGVQQQCSYKTTFLGER